MQQNKDMYSIFWILQDGQKLPKIKGETCELMNVFDILKTEYMFLFCRLVYFAPDN